jgi:hypothetical protein
VGDVSQLGGQNIHHLVCNSWQEQKAPLVPKNLGLTWLSTRLPLEYCQSAICFLHTNITKEPLCCISSSSFLIILALVYIFLSFGQLAKCIQRLTEYHRIVIQQQRIFLCRPKTNIRHWSTAEYSADNDKNRLENLPIAKIWQVKIVVRLLL